VLDTNLGSLQCSFVLDPGTPPGTMLAAMQFIGPDATTALPTNAGKTLRSEQDLSGTVTTHVVAQDTALPRSINAGEIVRFEQLPAGYASLSVVTCDGQFPVLILDG